MRVLNFSLFHRRFLRVTLLVAVLTAGYWLRIEKYSNIKSYTINIASTAINPRSAKLNMYSCDEASACDRLKQFFKENWNGSKPIAAVYILTRAKDAPQLKKT